MKCLSPKCENELPDGVRSTRKFCSGACRQEYFRQQHQQDQAQGRTFTEMLSELMELRAKVHDQEKTIIELEIEKAELTSQLSKLHRRLDVERRFLEDITPRYFRAWLKKQPSSPWRDRFLSDQLVPARGSRSLYQAHIRRLHCTEEEQEDFTRLWKLMLLQM
jgi:hypothetical protein